MRFLGALGGAAVFTLALFWMMQAMIAADTGLDTQNGRLKVIEFVRFDRDSRTNVHRRALPEKPKLRNRPAAPATAPLAKAARPVAPDFAMALPALDLPVNISGDPSLEGVLAAGPTTAGAVGGGEGDLMPLVRVAPLYPRRAQMRGLEGAVKVEFTITETGKVKDPSVLEATPPGIFDRAALQAILRWKFKPKTVEGKPVARRAFQVITFELSD